MTGEESGLGGPQDVNDEDTFVDIRETGERNVERETYVKIRTLWNSTEDGDCRVCGRSVSSPFNLYCSRYCKNVAEAVYGLFNWSTIRHWVLDRDNRACVRCGTASEDLAEGVSLEVDHITPISKNGHPFDPRNLQTLCQPCHALKGVSEEDFRGEDYEVQPNTEAPSTDEVRQEVLSDFADVEADETSALELGGGTLDE